MITGSRTALRSRSLGGAGADQGHHAIRAKAATPEACRELVWITWDSVADGSGPQPGRAGMGAQHLRMFASIIEGAGVLPSEHDRGYAPLIVMQQAEEIADAALASRLTG
jgi:hypothetical protein